MSETGRLQEDHDDVWTWRSEVREEEYSATEAETRVYRERAQEALKRNLFALPGGYPACLSGTVPYPRHLWVNDEYNGTVSSRVIQLCGARPVPKFAPDATSDLIMWATTTPQPGETRRRIIVVEDMNRQTAELLGVRLNIPPEFFFAHDKELLHLSVVDHASTPQSDRYWRVHLPAQRWVMGALSPEHSGKWTLEAGFYSRGETNLRVPQHTPWGIPIESFEHVSYWATEYENESWTVLLLVDPSERILRSMKNPETTLKLGPRLFSGRSATEVLPSATEGPIKQAESRSLYESIWKAHAAVAVEHDCKPISGTAFVRNLVRAAWEQLISQREWALFDYFQQDRYEHELYEGINAMKQKHAEKDRNAQNFHGMMGRRVELQMWRKRLKTAMRAFSMDTVDQGSEQRVPVHAKLTCSLTQEGRIWTELYEKLATMEATISNHMEALSARAALEGSFAAYRQAEEANRQTNIANRHARSSGQLTKIATIIVPCTFVASIFSMGGPFAAGEHLFFVYWAISVPITIALLSWVLHGDIKKMWHKWRGNQNKEGKQADKMA